MGDQISLADFTGQGRTPAAASPAAKPGEISLGDFTGHPGIGGPTTPAAPKPAPATSWLDTLTAPAKLLNKSVSTITGGVDHLVASGARAVGASGVAGYFDKDGDNEDTYAASPTTGATTWADVKQHPLGSILPYMIDAGVGSVPDLVLGSKLPGLYGASRLGSVAQERAQNNAPGSRASVWDYAAAAPAAAADTALMKYGAGAWGAGSLAKAALREGAVMAGAPVVDYAGTNLGTRAGFDPAEAGDRALAGLVSGAGLGAAMHMAGHIGARRGNTAPDGPLDWHTLDEPTQQPAPMLALPDLRGEPAPPANSNQPAPTGNPNGATTPDTIVAPYLAEVAKTDPAQAQQLADAWTKLKATLAPETPAAPSRDLMGTTAALTTPEDIWARIAANRQTPANDAAPPPSFTIPPRPATPVPFRDAPATGSVQARIGHVESPSDTAKNPLSSASGRYQFTDKTWLGVYRQEFGDTGESVSQIIAKKTNGAIQDRLMNRLTSENAAGLKAAGLPTDAGATYLAHFAGLHGAEKLFRADPSAPVVDVLGQGAVDANRFLRGKTVGDAIGWAYKKMGGATPADRAPVAPAAPERASLTERPADPAPSLPDEYQGHAAASAIDPTTGEMARDPAMPAPEPDLARASDPAPPADAPPTPERADAPPAVVDRAPGAPDPAVARSTAPDSPAPITGRDETVFTSRGRQVDTQHEVREARDIITSSDPTFDPALQPRDRSRAASDTQIAEMAGRLNPRLLADNPLAAHGAPIIGPDRMAETGNGRMAAINRAYDTLPEQAAKYRAMVEQRHPEAASMERPVLVRRRTTEMNPADRQAWVREANERETMGMSSPEQAGSDAKAMTPQMVASYRGGDMTDARNREFVRQFLDKAVPHSEHNTLVDENGVPSPDGVQRLNRAMLARAYDAPDLVRDIAEKGDTNIKAVGNAMTRIAPRVAQLNDLIESGHVDRQFSLSEPLADLARRVRDARDGGKPIANIVSEDSMFDTAERAASVSPETTALLRLFFRADKDGGLSQQPRSVDKVVEALEGYIDRARQGPDAFGHQPTALEALHDERAKVADPNEGAVPPPVAARRVDPGSGRDQRPGGEAGAGPDRGRPDEGNGRDPAQAAETGQAGPAADLAEPDMFGGATAADQRGALERAGEGRQQSDVAQKPPGSDGGLFDAPEAHREQPGMFGDGSPSPRDADADALRSLRDGKTLDPATVAGLIDKGLLAHEPGFERPRITDAGRALLRGQAARGGEGGFITAGTLTAPWRAVGKLVFDKDFLENDSPALTTAVRDTFGEPKAAAKGMVDRLGRFSDWAFFTADNAFRSLAGRFEAPTITKLADIFHAEAGVTDHATGRTYAEATARHGNRFAGILHDALEPHLENAPALGRIRDLLAEPTKATRATAAERAAAGKVRDLLKEVHDYRLDAGESLGEVKDGYFPRQALGDAVAKDPVGFLKAAEEAYRRSGADDPAASAAAYLQAVTDGHFGITDGVSQIAPGKPGTVSTKAREFGKEADELLRPFYDTNPLNVLHNYISGAVKSAERERRFGMVGREGSPERGAWLKANGDRTQWDVMRDQIKSELRSQNVHVDDAVTKLDMLRQDALGMARPGGMKTSPTLAYVHAWNQLTILPKATVARLPEMAMGFVRTGSVRQGLVHLGAIWSEFARNVMKMEPSEARRYAEAAGAVGHDGTMALLHAQLNDPASNAVMKKTLYKFYRSNGHVQWTDAGRVAATKTGQRFISELAGDMVSTNARTRARAAGYLRELGARDPDAFASALRGGGAPTADALRQGDSGFGADYATALLRFADQTVMNPTSSTRPQWANHPIGRLVFAVQSFNSTFGKNVLMRVGRQAGDAVKDRDVAKLGPAAGLVALTATTALTLGLRKALFGGATGDEEESRFHYLMEVADRSQLFAGMSMEVNALMGLRYRRGFGESMQGAVIGRTADAATAVAEAGVKKAGQAFGYEQPDNNAAERKAAGAVYDLVAKPTIDYFGAHMRGLLSTAAVMGTGGHSRNGLIPSDREAIVDKIAGPKPDPAD